MTNLDQLDELLGATDLKLDPELIDSVSSQPKSGNEADRRLDGLRRDSERQVF